MIFFKKLFALKEVRFALEYLETLKEKYESYDSIINNIFKILERSLLHSQKDLIQYWNTRWNIEWYVDSEVRNVIRLQILNTNKLFTFFWTTEMWKWYELIKIYSEILEKAIKNSDITEKYAEIEIEDFIKKILDKQKISKKISKNDWTYYYYNTDLDLDNYDRFKKVLNKINNR